MGDPASSDGVEAPRPISAGRNALGGYPCVGDLSADPGTQWGACGAEAEFVVGAELDFGLVLHSVCMKHLLSVVRFLEWEAISPADVETIEGFTERWQAEQVNVWQVRKIEDAG